MHTPHALYFNYMHFTLELPCFCSVIFFYFAASTKQHKLPPTLNITQKLLLNTCENSTRTKPNALPLCVVM